MCIDSAEPHRSAQLWQILSGGPGSVGYSAGSAQVVAAQAPRGWPVGLQAGLSEAAGRGAFSPPGSSQATGLQERADHHGHERVLARPRPGAALEVVEPKHFLELLVRLRHPLRGAVLDRTLFFPFFCLALIVCSP